MNPVCREHPAVDAHYRCDDCGRPLCDECVELASRLAVCLPCGGLARPLVRGGEPPAGPGTAASGAAPEVGPRPLAEILAWPLLGGFGVLFDFADHARTIGRHAPELARAATLCAVPLALAVSARTFFPVHVVGGVLETVLALYGAVLGAHVAGLFLGRHRDELASLYLE